MPVRSRYRRCRYCPALVIWAETPRGRRMPVDVERVPKGNVRLIWRDLYDDPLAVVLSSRLIEELRAENARAYEQGFSDEEELRLHTSHFATCPKSEEARRKAQAAAAAA
jgi:hypothetical protein